MNFTFLVSLLIAYLLGSIPFAYLIASRVKGIDLRTVGSRNVGGRNLTRNLGIGWGFLGSGLDVAKGAAAMAVASGLGIEFPLAYFAGMAAVAGHNWPIWLNFRGGKGLATALGALLWVAPAVGLIGFAVAMTVLSTTKNILLTALIGFITFFVSLQILRLGAEIHWFVLGLFIVVLLASFPDILHKLRTTGGVREYMQHPNKVYELDAKRQKNLRRDDD
ncbi:MAG: glycerol-3-phosphate acyltransferase [Chloroflexi bacterium]|nr:glycerol-3-phosphate acyltransferase [Chloroflexota bacterium]